ncbi:MAG: hypothetical protein JW969_01670 [Spirochaetales bacterium]|nr:hypothetical protein [Spirochaetales bacterium]
MGGEVWQYFVPHQDDIKKALHDLKEQVFRSGKYRGSASAPGSIDEAIESMGEIGTASILDITHISESMEPCAVSPFSEEDLEYFFDTTMPTHETIERNHDFWDDIERGCGVYIIVYKNGKPDEIFFGGYSFD